MSFKRCALFLCLLLSFASPAAGEATLSFPCDPDLSPFLAESEHEISYAFDLAQCYRMQIDFWDDDIPDDNLMVESGSLLVLDDQFMIISLRFSEDYDYEAGYTHLPERIMLVNHDPNVSNDTDLPEWRVMMVPDQDDPYSFHYAGTWNLTMSCIRFYGSYSDPQGELYDCFSLHVDM